ncbi:5'-(N(7)-methyl 5'-triphosphoguanosine)-(mRNA) diphosphatase [Saccharomycopsis crataegensis]|uniref:m7GpppX diphosphatase n=1 Tax=Saccharomycopsis crataegensis TaxID=43959 RepID=A0AAV5QU71_9ASCO|nr:5'-(N(7)-methyl 5'-triphosphoguanosine)-(mRNA) diphosphatase [Saccharomycopsis crataegensis]
MDNLSYQNLLKSFKFVRILESDTQEKTLSLLGTIDNQDAIVRLERLHYDNPSSQDSLASLIDVANLLKIGDNDIYSWFSVSDLPDVQSTKLNLIYPATQKHISKYNHQPLHMVRETAEMYRDIVAPYIESMKGLRIQWVKNILFQGAEAESVIYRDHDPVTGFVLLPDMKWDGRSSENLYIVGIVNREDVASVRDLRGAVHLSWLENLKEKSLLEVSTRYGIGLNDLKVFVHYQPSYYHFHIHIVNVAHEGLRRGIAAGKAILLDDIIENLKLSEDGYAKRTMCYEIGENHDLWKLLVKR